ncbi:MAG: tRNA pseudouridine38-40 synthase [Planctomycetota bacterium]|jgi:tRNA pseudouridine38-40 synthase
MNKRYFLEIAFDGANYFGWQIQPNHISVQEKISKILSSFYNQPIKIMGCGRTDTGVHAKQYFLHFDAPIERSNIFESIKMMFPVDIQLINVHEVNQEAHARFDATERSYTYHLHQKKNIFKRHYSLGVSLDKLDFDKINEACAVFLRQTNYACLCKKNPELKDYVSKVAVAKWSLSEVEKSAKFSVTANRFLHNQIRRMVGALLLVGSNKMDVSELESAMENNLSLKYNDTVKANALFLHSIKYPYIL